MSNILSISIDLLFLYLGIGVLFGIWFVLKGAAKLDNGVKGTPWHFRLILLPGSILMWSVLIYKLISKKS